MVQFTFKKISKLKKGLVELPLLAGSLCVALLLVIPVKASSQDLSFGLKAGINRSRIGQNYIYEGRSYDETMVQYQTFTRTGWNAGATVEYSTSRWTYQSGLSLVVKGNKGNMRSLNPEIHPTDNLDSELRINYLQIPLTALYKIKLSKLVLFVGGGPYVALGISGKDFSKGSFWDHKYDEYHKVRFNTVTDISYYYNEIKRTDMGLNWQIGVDLLKNANFSATFEQSLSSKYRIFGFNLGYRLFSMKKTGES